MTQYGFYLDSDKCTGCKTCQVACQQKHDLPAETSWRKVYNYESGSWNHDEETGVYTAEDVFGYFISMACNHCEKPACMEVCPIPSAITKDAETGIVAIHEELCDGCGLCSDACPYDAPSLWKSKGVFTKCDMCSDLLEQGKRPLCVSSCSMRILDFGDIEELKKKYGPGDIEVAPLPENTTAPAFILKPHRNAQGTYARLNGAAVTFATLGALVYDEPSERLTQDILENDLFATLPFGEGNSMVEEGKALLKKWRASASKMSLDEATDVLKGEWLRLLVGYGTPLAPPWFSYYAESTPQVFGKKTLEVRAAYARHGLSFERKNHEPDDHLGIMLQFVATLISREAKAFSEDDISRASTYRKERKAFLQENVIPWVSHWKNLVLEDSASPFYQGLALLIAGSLQSLDKLAVKRIDHRDN